MDHRRFDQIARDLAGARSRRSLLKGLCLAVAGVLATGVEPAAADNLCKPSGNSPQSKCNKNAQCCSQFCYQGNCCTALTSCTAAQCGQTISDNCGGRIECPAC